MTIQELFRLGMKRDINEIRDMPFGCILNLGAGNHIIPNTVVLDWPDWNADEQKIPYPDNSIDGIHAYHFFEHLNYPATVLEECQRVLKSGGIINIVVPFWDCQMAHQDLDHKNTFTETTWKVLFDNPHYKKFNREWRFAIIANFIMGIDSKNLALFTQMVKI